MTEEVVNTSQKEKGGVMRALTKTMKSRSSNKLKEEVLEDMTEVAAGLSRAATLSTDISHPSLLRAIPIMYLLAGFGRQFKARNLAAQSFTEDEAKVMYAMSREVAHIDGFVSHCWRSSRMGKVLALLIYSNNVAATIVSAIVTALTAYVYTQGWLPLRVGNCEAVNNGMTYGPWCWFFGSSSFFVTFFYWHVVVDYIGAGRGYFFDKLCVHQFNKERQMAGILSFAAFVSHAKEFILLWDTLHFTRLWCTLEVASLIKTHGNNRIPLTFLPLELANFAFVGWLMFTFTQGLARLNNLLDNIIPADVLIAAAGIFAVYACVRASRVYMVQRKALSVQLGTFKVAEACCFLERDREIVNSTLIEWFGSLDAFDEHVHTTIKDKILSTIGSELHYPFRYVWPFLTLRIYGQVDLILAGHFTLNIPEDDSIASHAIGMICFAVLTMTFLPIFLRVANLHADKLESRWKDIALNLAMTIGCLAYAQGTLVVSVTVMSSQPVYITIPYLVLCVAWTAWLLRGSITGFCMSRRPAKPAQKAETNANVQCLETIEDEATIV